MNHRHGTTEIAFYPEALLEGPLRELVRFLDARKLRFEPCEEPDYRDRMWPIATSDCTLACGVGPQDVFDVEDFLGRRYGASGFETLYSYENEEQDDTGTYVVTSTVTIQGCETVRLFVAKETGNFSVTEHLRLTVVCSAEVYADFRSELRELDEASPPSEAV